VHQQHSSHTCCYRQPFSCIGMYIQHQQTYTFTTHKTTHARRRAAPCVVLRCDALRRRIRSERSFTQTVHGYTNRSAIQKRHRRSAISKLISAATERHIHAVYSKMKIKRKVSTCSLQHYTHAYRHKYLTAQYAYCCMLTLPLM